MTQKVADVSLFATNYNNAEYLLDFFESIQNSTCLPKEIVFIDDGSTDNSLEIANQYLDKFALKIHALGKNMGRSYALNFGKQKCISTYTMLIDPDDSIFPDRIEKQYRLMIDKPNIDLCGGNVHYFNSETGKDINISNFPLSHNQIVKSFLKGENGILQPTVMIKTELYQKYEYRGHQPAEDYDFFARIAKDGCRFESIPDLLNRMRIHPNSAVSSMTYKGLELIFDARDSIFNTKTGKFRKYFYFIHLKNYRKSMLTHNVFKTYWYILLSTLAQPSKIFKRIFNLFRK